MKVYEALASALQAEEVGPIFGLMGDGVMSLWGILGRIPGQVLISARHEAGAVAMADGWFRATDRVGVAMVTCGPGLTQIGTSLMAAARGRSALVVLSGEAAPDDKASLQSMDQRPFVEACSTRFHTISRPGSLAEDIAEAFFTARQHRCPVVLNLPMDVQAQAFDWDFDYRPSTEFLAPPQGTASEADLERIAEKLVEGERPVIISGRGARIAGAKDALMRLADMTGALLATSLQAKGLFSEHPFDVGISGAYASAPTEALLATADLVIGFGAELGYYTCEGGLMFPTAEIIRIDTAPGPCHIGVAPGLYVRGDARETAHALCERLAGRPRQHDGYRIDATKAFAAPLARMEPAHDGVDPRAFMRSLSTLLPHNVMVTCGVGHFLGFVAMHLALPADADFQVSGQFGAIGQTLPVAIGIGLAHRDRPHLVIEGDGSLMMNIQEIETAVRIGLSIVLVVWNDEGFGAEVHKLHAKGFDSRLAVYGSPDFVAVARGMGGDGSRVDSLSDLDGAVRDGFARGGLFVVDVHVSPSTVSDAYLKLHFGAPNNAPRLRLPEPV